MSLSKVCNCSGCGVLGNSRFVGVVLNSDFVCENADGCRELKGSNLQCELDGELKNGEDSQVADCVC